MNRWRSICEFEARRAGIIGAVGIVLWLVLPAFYWSGIRPLHDLASSLDLRRTQFERASPVFDPSRHRNERMRAFVEFFPVRKEIPFWIHKIHEAAAASGVVLERGEYRRGADGETPLLPAPIKISFPVKGGYADIRRFLATALAEVPTLSLDDVAFQRKGVGDARIEAQIRFTLFVGER